VNRKREALYRNGTSSNLHLPDLLRRMTEHEANRIIDYYLNSLTTLCRRIWMSFFGTEEVHAVMLDIVADRGGLPWSDDKGK
jgi:hypothetical protein